MSKPWGGCGITVGWLAFQDQSIRQRLVDAGLRRTIALYCRSSTLYQICEDERCLFFLRAATRRMEPHNRSTRSTSAARARAARPSSRRSWSCARATPSARARPGRLLTRLWRSVAFSGVDPFCMVLSYGRAGRLPAEGGLRPGRWQWPRTWRSSGATSGCSRGSWPAARGSGPEVHRVDP
jgi:hypothetical protein